MFISSMRKLCIISVVYILLGLGCLWFFVSWANVDTVVVKNNFSVFSQSLNPLKFGATNKPNSIKIHTNLFDLAISYLHQVRILTPNDLTFSSKLHDIETTKKGVKIFLDSNFSVEAAQVNNNISFNVSVPTSLIGIKAVEIPIQFNDKYYFEGNDDDYSLLFTSASDADEKYVLTSENLALQIVDNKYLRINISSGEHQLVLKPRDSLSINGLKKWLSNYPVEVDATKIAEINQILRRRLSADSYAWDDINSFYYVRQLLDNGLDYQFWVDRVKNSALLTWRSFPLFGDVSDALDDRLLFSQNQKRILLTEPMTFAANYDSSQKFILEEIRDDVNLQDQLAKIFVESSTSQSFAVANLWLDWYSTQSQESEYNFFKDWFLGMLKKINRFDDGSVSLKESDSSDIIALFYVLSKAYHLDLPEASVYYSLAQNMLMSMINENSIAYADLDFSMEDQLLEGERLFYWQEGTAYLGLANSWPNHIVTSDEGLEVLTMANNTSIRRSGSRYTVSLELPIGSTHYFVIRNVSNIQNFTLLGLPWRQDPGFSLYHSGYYYNEARQEVYVKLTNRQAREQISFNIGL